MKVPIRENSVCTAPGFKSEEKLQICAGGEKGKSACRGDSGSGLFLKVRCLQIECQYQDNAICQDESKTRSEGPPWYIIGIVSYGASNCEVAIPEVYVR